MAILKVHDRTRDRYHALTISTVWDRDVVRRSRALIVGAGALGNEVAKNLAMMGVAIIVAVDRDTVEMANLTRSIFFREADHGHPKVACLAGRIREFNPDVEVVTLHGDLEDKVGLGLLRRMDLVFSCLDNRLARWSLNRMCEQVGKPWVDGSMEDLLGEVSVYQPGETACYACTLTALDMRNLAQATSCRGIALERTKAGKVPTTSTMGSIVAALQVQEALKLLHGGRRSLAGKRLILNCILNDFDTVTLDRKAGCMGHFRFGEITEVPEFSAGSATIVDILNRFKTETGSANAYVNVGREIVTELRCARCGTAERPLRGVRSVREAEATCLTCGDLRVAETAHTLTEDDPLARLPLKDLGIPELEVLEVRGDGAVRWYELTGDLAAVPESIRAAARTAEAFQEVHDGT
jgi:adenylyltransferase/sulfurtransferase